MDLRFATLADAANVSQEGKLNITGMFSKISVQRFPSPHAGASLVLIFESHPAEHGPHSLRILFVNADGQQKMEINVEFVIPEAESKGKPQKGEFVMALPPIPLEAQGDYSFDIFMDKRYVGSVPIEAVSVQGPGG